MACRGKSEPAKSPSPATLAIVYPGWEVWIGNDDIVPEGDPSRYPGVLKPLEAGFAKIDLAALAPAGSQGLIVVYADKPMLRVPLGPITNLTSKAFGTQKDYDGMQGLGLVRGIEFAVSELAKAPAGKKLLIVLSDDHDTNDDAARGELAALKQRTGTLGIEVVALLYKTELSVPVTVISSLTDNVKTEVSGESLATDMARAFEHLNQ